MNTIRFSQRFILFIITSLLQARGNEGCTAKADIVFLLDGSDSISDQEFLLEKKLVSQFVRTSSIGMNNIRVGLLVFSSDIEKSLSLTNSTVKNNVLRTIETVTQPQDGSRLDLGINQIEQMFYTEGRTNVSHIGIIVSDGRSKYPDATRGESEALRAMGIKLVTVGVGRLVEDKALGTIATMPEYFVYIEPFTDAVHKVTKIAESIGMEWCSGPITKLSENDATKQTFTPALSSENKELKNNHHMQKTPEPIIVQIPSEYVSNSPQLDISENKFSVSKVKQTVSVTSALPPKVIPVKSDKDGQHLNPTPKPWWDQQYNVPDNIQHDLGWYTTEQPTELQQTWRPQTTTPRSLWQVHQHQYIHSTTPPPPKVQTDPPWNPQTEMAWDNAYRNPVRAIKLFDINVPLAVPYVNKGPASTSKPRFTPKPIFPSKLIYTAKPPSTSKPTSTTPRRTTSLITTKSRYVHFTKSPPPSSTVRPKGQDDGHDTDKAMQKLCFGSQFVDGVGYNTDPKSCNEFIQCFYNGGKIQVEKARCPFRMFWDQRLLLCRPASSMQCWRDPCFDYHVRSYDHKGNCRAHWSCKDGLSTAKCCPVGFGYKEGQGCVRDSTCVDWCEDTGDLTFSAPFASCRMTPFETNEKFYFEEIPGLGMMTRSCPRGSQFNAGLCTCEISEDVRTQTCRPELSLDFTDGFSDKSGNNLAVTPQNVHVENGAARFDGNGRLTIWRFSGFSFGSQLTITMKYKESSNRQMMEAEHLISNCCCMDNPGPSLDIKVEPRKQVTFVTETNKDGQKSTSVSFNQTDWKTIKYIYNGRELIGEVEGRRSSVPVLGVIEERPAALVIGSCDFFGGLNGYVDDVRLYLCVPERRNG